MNILYIITQADGGGAQKYTLELAKAFNGSLAAGNEAGSLFYQAKELNIPTFELRHLKREINLTEDILAIWEIRQLIKQIRPNIVHLNSTKAGILGSFASIGLGAKVIFTAHGFIFNEPLSKLKKNFYIATETIASDFRDFIITVSNADKKSAFDNKIIQPNKIQTIHNGIKQINFLDKETAQSKLNLDPSKFNIGCVANFYHTKGLDILIEAISLLPEEIKNNINVSIIGKGPEEINLKSKIQNLNLESIFKLKGNKENASTYLKAFDLYVQPSRKEGFPYSILEAMQAGLPIIASDTGGIYEALDNTGVLVKPENPQELCSAIEDLLQNEAKRKDLSQKALEKSKLFTLEKMLEETKTIYEQILK